MSTASDPRYQALAELAGAELGATSDVAIRAILAQWQCELGAGEPWPVPRNNPGNISKCGVQPGIPYTVAPNAPNGANCPIVTFATPQTGAHAYAAYLLARMPGALAYLRAGNALAFLQTVAAGGYGTSSTCMTAVYRSIATLPINPGVIPASQPTGAGDVTTASFIPKPTVDRWYACLGKSPFDTIDAATAAAMVTCAQSAGLDLQGLSPSNYTGQHVGDFVTAIEKAAGQYIGADTIVNDLLTGLAGALIPVVAFAVILMLLVGGLFLTLSPGGSQ